MVQIFYAHYLQGKNFSFGQQTFFSLNFHENRSQANISKMIRKNRIISKKKRSFLSKLLEKVLKNIFSVNVYFNLVVSYYYCHEKLLPYYLNLKIVLNIQGNVASHLNSAILLYNVFLENALERVKKVLFRFRHLLSKLLFCSDQKQFHPSPSLKCPLFYIIVLLLKNLIPSPIFSNLPSPLMEKWIL